MFLIPGGGSFLCLLLWASSLPHIYTKIQLSDTLCPLLYPVLVIPSSELFCLGLLIRLHFSLIHYHIFFIRSSRFLSLSSQSQFIFSSFQFSLHYKLFSPSSLHTLCWYTLSPTQLPNTMKWQATVFNYGGDIGIGEVAEICKTTLFVQCCT